MKNPIQLTRIKNDSYGNPRVVCHFLSIISPTDEAETPQGLDHISALYDRALRKAKKIGGRKFHNRQYGGGIAFQCFNETELQQQLAELAKQ